MLKDKKTDWLHYGSAGLVFLVSYLVFNWTKAPTLSFWDCGEFIACAAILGIPHPPGAPLYVLIGRLFTLLPISDDIAVRVNLVSVISSAFTAMVGYLIVHRLIDYWTNEKTEWQFRIWKYVGGISGGLTLAFSRTFWSSAVEAEVYGLAMLVTLLILYLGILWWQRPSETRGNQYLILAAYLGILGTALHMTVFLALPPVMLLVLLADEEKRKDWRIWVSGLVLLLVVASLDMFLVALAAWTVVTVAVMFSNPRAFGWQLPLGLCLAAVLGFSSQFFIPIRAAQSPHINENDPDDWKSFKYFLERKQYGQTNMITRAMKRRGEPSNQYGRYPRMGFWGFFEKQYGLTKVFFLLLVVGLWGLYESWRKSRSPGIMLLATVLFGTIGLVWYMNFADGTRQDPITGEGYLEVRDRDYFWTPGFIVFALCIGLGLAALGYRLVEWIKEKNLARPFLFVPGAVALSALAFPYFGFTSNFSVNQRINNYLPYDYAYNLLSSCEPNSVLFTNGDNDTFPLWALQEAYGFRRDVKNINLSLINTNWYILQKKHQDSVPISLSDEEIARLAPDFNPATGRMTKRIQDKIIDNVLETNQWKLPVHFSVTCASDARMYRGRSVDPYLIMRGMAYDVVPQGAGTGTRIDISETRRFYERVFRYRGTADPKVRKDENDWRIIQNYVSAFMFIADTLRKAGDLKQSEAVIRKAMAISPREVTSYQYLIGILADQKRVASAESLVETAPLPETTKDSIRNYLAMIYLQERDSAKAEKIFAQSYERNKAGGFNDLVAFYYQIKNYRQVERVINDWLSAYPNDARAPEVRTFLESVRQQIQSDTSKLPAPTK
ncbi:MAG: protein O-mannosyl-transferase family [Limisphaerales bacterium]